MTEDKFLTTVERYDGKLNQWKPVGKTMREGKLTGRREGYHFPLLTTLREIEICIKELGKHSVFNWLYVFRLTARCRFDAVSIGDIVYFVGGMCNDPYQNTLELYCPTMAVEPVKLPAPKLPRYDHCTAVLDGKIYFIGGKGNYI